MKFAYVGICLRAKGTEHATSTQCAKTMLLLLLRKNTSSQSCCHYSAVILTTSQGTRRYTTGCRPKSQKQNKADKAGTHPKVAFRRHTSMHVQASGRFIRTAGLEYQGSTSWMQAKILTKEDRDDILGRAPEGCQVSALLVSEVPDVQFRRVPGVVAAKGHRPTAPAPPHPLLEFQIPFQIFTTVCNQVVLSSHHNYHHQAKRRSFFLRTPCAFPSTEVPSFGQKCHRLDRPCAMCLPV